MTELFRRNARFQKNLAIYKMVIDLWVWRGKKNVNKDTLTRHEMRKNIDLQIFVWEVRTEFYPWHLAWFFITPPDEQIEKVISK